MADTSALLLMNAESTPLLHRDATVRAAGEGLVIETPLWEFSVKDRGLVLSRLLARADGATSLRDLAAEVGLDTETAILLLEPLAEEGAVIDASAVLRAAADGFLDTFQKECHMMMRTLSEQPFWQQVLSGRANRNLILGWGIEFTHFVEAANEYMPLGIAHAREGVAVRELFSRHYAEEADHSAIFLKGLVECGLDRARITKAPPLATTRALINLLVEHAIEGAVPYAAGFAVMQPEVEAMDKEKVHGFYADLAQRYPFAVSMFRAFERHAGFDIDLCHHKTVFAGLDELGAIPQAARTRAVETARAVAEAFILFFEGILDTYGAPTAEVPRRPARI